MQMKNNDNNGNSNIASAKKITKKQKDKNPFDNCLKRKIIKIKEKAKSSATASNTINNSNSLINNTIFNTSQNNSSINSNLPATSYLSKMKVKISFEKKATNNANINHFKKEINKPKKRSNSTIEDQSKQNHYINNNNPFIKHNNIYSKYISSSSPKKYINNSRKTSNSNSNSKNNILKKQKVSSMKNSTVFSSTIKSQSKQKFLNLVTKSGKSNKSIPKICSGFNSKSKTSYPTKTNSRKHSNEKGRKNSTNSSTKHTTIVHTKGRSENPPDAMKNKQRSINNSKHKEKRLSVNIKSNLNLIINKINNKESTSNDKYQNKYLKTKQKIAKDLKNKNNIIDKVICEEKNGNIKVKKEKDNLNKKEKKDKTKQNEKEKLYNVDRDIDDSINKNDKFLNELNIGIDNNKSITGNSNESFDSINSSLQGNLRVSSVSKDKDLITNYIKKYYKNIKEYPSTKIRFYKYGRLLGKGAFGKVNLSLHTLTGRLVAIKSINKGHLKSEKQKKKFAQETSIMKTLSHSKYIVKFYETFETQKHICIVMEYICAGDLLSYIKKRSKLNEPIAKILFKQIILALQYIHRNNIVHRDIKLDNILIDFDNIIKICDFGVSKNIKKGDIMMEQCGTPVYIAPEILYNKGYEGYPVDIWSAGVVLYAMLSGTVPFKGTNLKNLHEVIMKGSYIPLKEVSRDASDLISCLLEVDPKKRITIDKILLHPWLLNVDVNNSNGYNLFTNAERIILAKSNVDYRNINNKENMNEIFTFRNIDTFDDCENKNANTKSEILAPFNSSLESEIGGDYYSNNCRYSKNMDEFDIYDNLLFIRNNVIKFGMKVKELNKNYELNNNGEIDNGVIISQNESFKEKEQKNFVADNGKDCNKIKSKQFSPFGETNENYNNNTLNQSSERSLNEEAIREMVTLGYDRSTLINWIKKNKFNYATAGYYVLSKFYNYSD